MRKEERFFIDVAERYGLRVNVEAETISKGGLTATKVHPDSKLWGCA